jgi:hypothetical protein
LLPAPVRVKHQRRGAARFRARSREADQQGALQLLAGKPYGLVSLWLLGIGFAAYALWRLSEAAFGVTGEPNSAGASPRLTDGTRSSS